MRKETSASSKWVITMADQIFEIKFHNLFGYKFGRIVDEAHNLYNGDEGWATKDEVKVFMDKYLEALNKEHLRRVNRQKYKRCLAMAEICRNEWCTLYYERKKYSENRFLDHLMAKKDRHKNIWLKLAEKFKEAK